jgi:predicted NBD/HSP70 family sugar kinase
MSGLLEVPGFRFPTPVRIPTIPGYDAISVSAEGEEATMVATGRWVVVGLDNGGTANNATVLDSAGNFLVDGLVETPSRVREGPDVAIEALAEALHHVLELTGTPLSSVRAVGLDTPGPASATGVISSKGATNFSEPPWRGFDFRGALAQRLDLPVIYNNDGNAAALYAHHQHFGPYAQERSSVSAIIGTGLGGGVIESGRIVRGAAGMAGEFGHIHIPMDGLLEPDQPVPACNCGFVGDAESVASLTGIELNLLPYWLSRYDTHELAVAGSLSKAAKLVRGFGESGDELALKVFGQQAMALGRLFTIAANFSDPDAYFVGGGVVQAEPHFRDWYLDRVREHTALREEQRRVATFALVPDLDMAGSRGAALAALAATPS